MRRGIECEALFAELGTLHLPCVMSGDERLRKRVKIGHDDGGGGGGGGGGGRGATSTGKKNWSTLKDKKNREGQGKPKPKYPHSGSGSGSNFSASGLHSGDVGVFVTCDKGMEKRALREVEDLLGEILGVEESGGDGEVVGFEGWGGNSGGEGEGIGGGEKEGVVAGRSGDAPEGGEVAGGRGPENDIESEIRAELQEMRGKGRVEDARTGKLRAADGTAGAPGNDTATIHHDSTGVTEHSKPTTTTALGLVTLDIPCVSFVRLPQLQRQPHDQSSEKTALSNVTSELDPVSLVYDLCRAAYRDPLRQRSRYIKRLTPVSKVRKVLGEGVERLCAEVLDDIFAARPVATGRDSEGDGEGEDERRGWKYAIRVTVRNNNQVSKEEIIKTVAGYVVAVGKGDASARVTEGGRDGGNTSSEDEADDNELEAGNSLVATSIKDKPSGLGSTIDGKEETSHLVPREHKVDLKNYEKLILVEVYRNVVGMSVVGDAREYETQLRKFNLAEIYAEGRKRALGEGEVEGKKN